jgi:hypothetical protein
VCRGVEKSNSERKRGKSVVLGPMDRILFLIIGVYFRAWRSSTRAKLKKKPELAKYLNYFFYMYLMFSQYPVIAIVKKSGC